MTSLIENLIIQLIIVVILGGSGVLLFYAAFDIRRRKRLIENTPTSRVRSVAAGLCELHGKAKSRSNPLRGPLSNAPCVFYKYSIERYEKSWHTEAEDDSSHVFFLIDDGTGQALINPAGAEFDLGDPHFQFEGGGPFATPLPNNLIAFLDSLCIEYKTRSAGYGMRFKEWIIDEQDELFVLGTAHKEAISTSDFTKRLQAAIAELKSNPQDLRKVDTDKDGRISAGEWDAAVNAIRQHLLEEELRNSQTAGFPDTVISQGEEEKVFILSKESKKEFGTWLGLGFFLSVFTGPMLCIVAAVLLFVGVRSTIRELDCPVFPKGLSRGGETVPMDIEPQGKGIMAGTGAPNQTVRIKSYGTSITIETHEDDFWPQVFEIRTTGEVKKGRIPLLEETLAPADAAGIVSVLRDASVQRRRAYNLQENVITVFDKLAVAVESAQMRRKWHGQEGGAPQP